MYTLENQTYREFRRRSDIVQPTSSAVRTSLRSQDGQGLIEASGVHVGSTARQPVSIPYLVEANDASLPVETFQALTADVLLAGLSANSAGVHGVES